MQNKLAKNKIVLGGAQFGSPYSISRKYNNIDEKMKFKLLNFAYTNGINCIDLAQSYGNSEKLIGNYLKQSNQKWRIITKINSNKKNIDFCLEESYEKLNVKPHTVLAHDVEKYLDPQYCDFLHALKNKGVKKIGVSIYNFLDINKILTMIKPDVIQFPLNIIDNKIYKSKILMDLKKENIELHARSVWLQGLFFLSKDKIREKFEDIFPVVEELILLSNSYGISLPDLSLKWVDSLEEIDKIVIGVEDIKQLKINLKTLETKVDPLVYDKALLINYDNEEILNPSKWKK